MTVVITLTIAGTDSGPFDLYSNADNYGIPFATQISKAVLETGYTSTVVPDTATIVRVKSTGDCINSTDIPLTMLSFIFNLAKGATPEEACVTASSRVFDM